MGRQIGIDFNDGSNVHMGVVVAKLETTLSRLGLIRGNAVDKLLFWDMLETYWRDNSDKL